jgi:hypothetical protein
VSVVSLAVPLFAGAAGRADEAPPVSPEKVKVAVGKALPLLLKGAEGHIAKRTCFACHNQAIPLLAFTTARERGFAVRDEDLKKQLEFIAAFLEQHRENYRQGKSHRGQPDTAGYALFALELGGWKPDATTEAVVEYLLLHDKDLDHWRAAGDRPPSSGSDFTATALALRALRKWGVSGQKERITRRQGAARGWLRTAPARDTEDRVFRLWALQAEGAEENEVRSALRDLVRSQRADGGWGQTEGMDSDAYATGTTLVALHQAGGRPTTDPAYRRGVAFLLAHISQMNLGFRHGVCAFSPENPAFPTLSCRNDRGTQWVTATMTPCALTSTARSSWSSTARPSPVTPDSSPTGNSTTPSN